MAYEWTTGETITAAKLNATGGGVFWITATWDDTANGYLLDKTAAQIKAAFASGQLCKVIGGVTCEAEVMSTPFGELLTFSNQLEVDSYNNLLSLREYDFDPTTEVLTSTEYLYTLTPAS